jgi:hypothetical protein
MNKVYFISGHLDLSQEEFNTEYKDRILNALPTCFPSQFGSSFVVGDAKGCDMMAQSLLAMVKRQHPEINVIVFHMGKKPRHNMGDFKTIGGFKTDGERDRAMTNYSNDDIAWVRSEKLQREIYGDKYIEGRISGTMLNLMRRNAKNTGMPFQEPK